MTLVITATLKISLIIILVIIIIIIIITCEALSCCTKLTTNEALIVLFD
jgi:hypothetical protein